MAFKLRYNLAIIMMLLVSCAPAAAASSSSPGEVELPTLIKLFDGVELSNIINSKQIDLPKTLGDGRTLVWESSNNRFINGNGFVVQPAFGSGDKKVTLKATVANSNPLIQSQGEFIIKEQAPLVLNNKRSLPFTSVAKEYDLTPKNLDLYFNNNLDFPYVDIASFVNLIDGAINSKDFTFTPQGENLEVKFRYFDDDDQKEYIYTNLYDFKKNTLTIDSFDFFGAVSAKTKTDFGKGLEVAEYFESTSKTVIIPLGDYGFDLVVSDGLYLAPFQLVNQLYSGQMFNAYYNGDKIVGFDYWSSSSDTDAMQTSSFSTQAKSQDLKLFNYNYLALIMDYFYGLKGIMNVNTYHDLLARHQLNLVTSTDSNSLLELRRFIFSLADLHTSFSFPGYYEPRYTYSIALTNFVGRARDFYNFYVDQKVTNYCNTSLSQPYRLIDNGKTAVISFDSFEEDRGESGTINTLTPLILRAKNEDNVDNIVLDIACNLGGNVGALIRLLGFLTNDLIPLHYINPTDGKTGTYKYSNEIQAVDVNWYVLTSTLTFSAANMMASIVKENGLAKVVGLKSSGGASSIAPTILPNGAMIYISSLSMSANSRYQSIELGVEPDYKMTDFTSESELILAINATK
jgi:carboxyl-terminal processing protease